MNKILKICKNGHKFFKSSDCPVCPECEKNSKPKTGFLSTLSAPAKRALESNNIVTISVLSKYSEAEILKLHGIGKASIPTLRAALAAVGRKFKS
ncbi:MAG: hypothetical protein IPM96_02580 [Ignavibacteria bacterium]|nr:hypothetical protein [Ignavibacteria bacterium]